MRSFASNPVSRMMGTGRDLTALHRSGEELPVEIALSGLAGASGSRSLAVISDITGRKKAESALRQTIAQLEEFTYVVSHDLRAPLRGIADLLSWIREDLDQSQLNDAVQRNFERIAVRVERAERMIDDLLDYARAGKRDVKLEWLEPRQLVDEALSLVEVPEAFRVEIEAQGPAFRSAKAPLCLGLRNLINNAVKHHGRPSGHIRIAMREEGRFNVFSIEDDGQGVPRGAEERIFKLFHRANTQVDGHGVGLAVTRRMVNAHGGLISVQKSDRLGGACFAIYWPRIMLREADNE